MKGFHHSGCFCSIIFQAKSPLSLSIVHSFHVSYLFSPQPFDTRCRSVLACARPFSCVTLICHKILAIIFAVYRLVIFGFDDVFSLRQRIFCMLIVVVSQFLLLLQDFFLIFLNFHSCLHDLLLVKMSGLQIAHFFIAK